MSTASLSADIQVMQKASAKKAMKTAMKKAMKTAMKKAMKTAMKKGMKTAVKNAVKPVPGVEPRLRAKFDKMMAGIRRSVRWHIMETILVKVFGPCRRLI